MTEHSRIKVAPKTPPNLRKLARALILLVEQRQATPPPEPPQAPERPA